MRAFLRMLVRFDRSKFEPWLALRSAFGVGLPLLIGLLTGHLPQALAVTMGAFNVSFSDSHEPYPRRARRMLAASVLVAIAVFAGESSGAHPATIAIAGLWAFAAGMMVALSTAAADVGAISLVVLLVYAAAPESAGHAAVSGAMALVGGLWQTALSLSLWPVRRYAPERRALAGLYLELARAAAAPTSALAAPFASAESTEAQHKLSALGRDRSDESERYRTLLSEAERIRLGLLALKRARVRLERESPDGGEAGTLTGYLETSAAILHEIGEWLSTGRAVAVDGVGPADLQAMAEQLRRGAASPVATLAADARFQMDAVAGQLRAALDLAAEATPEGAAAAVRREQHLPWRLRFGGTVATLRANLDFGSAAFRHALRLAVCVAFGDAVGRALGVQRFYWLPMTIAIVLKPDFAATFSRGVLRLAGTFAGLAFATGMVHALPSSTALSVAEFGGLVYVMRYVGPANYGVLVTLVTAVVVVLMSLFGVAPGEVMAARALNTALGGAIALGAYGAWPTWERRQVAETMARMLDAYRDYFHLVQRSYVSAGEPLLAERDRKRLEARLARSNLEASLDRMEAEPGGTPEMRAILSGILANSHRLVHAVMALEAGLATSRPAPARAPFQPFARDVELTVYYLAAALRGSRLKAEELPDLRERHHALISSGDPATERYAVVNVETDRITNSLNTLSGEVLRWIG
jgi:uncharacterized membrane protein YccC